MQQASKKDKKENKQTKTEQTHKQTKNKAAKPTQAQPSGLDKTRQANNKERNK